MCGRGRGEGRRGVGEGLGGRGTDKPTQRPINGLGLGGGGCLEGWGRGGREGGGGGAGVWCGRVVWEVAELIAHELLPGRQGNWKSRIRRRGFQARLAVPRAWRGNTAAIPQDTLCQHSPTWAPICRHSSTI